MTSVQDDYINDILADLGTIDVQLTGTLLPTMSHQTTKSLQPSISPTTSPTMIPSTTPSEKCITEVEDLSEVLQHWSKVRLALVISAILTFPAVSIIC